MAPILKIFNLPGGNFGRRNLVDKTAYTVVGKIRGSKNEFLKKRLILEKNDIFKKSVTIMQQIYNSSTRFHLTV